MNEITVTTTEAEPLTEHESERLEQLEGVVAGGMKAFIEMGRALQEIRDDKLYRQSHGTFDEYVKARWAIGRSYASRLIGAAETAEVLPIGNNLPRPANESQMRPLLQFPVEDRPKVWRDVVGRVTPLSNGKAFTAHQIDSEVKRLIQNSKDAPYKKLRSEIRKAEKAKRQETAPKSMPEPKPESLPLFPEHENDPADVAPTVKSDGPICPNCGATEFDEDGDCAKCLHPMRNIESLGVAMQWAEEAINCLEKIPPKDKLRKRGYDTVEEWIQHNYPASKCADISERKRKNTGQFAKNIADVALTQLKRIPKTSPFQEHGYRIIVDYIRENCPEALTPGDGKEAP